MRRPIAALIVILTAQPSFGATYWNYASEKDAMTLKMAHYAQVESKNQVVFGFPYQGQQRASLTLRTHPQFGKDVLLAIERGQFLCGLGECTILVRFDENSPIAFSAGAPSDHSTTTLFIRNYAKFTGLMMKARSVTIQAEFFHEGSRVFEFDVSAFDPKKYRPQPRNASPTDGTPHREVARFLPFGAEADEVTQSLDCAEPKITPASPEMNLGALYGCVQGQAQTVKTFINASPSNGKSVQNVKFIWNDWWKDSGWGKHADNFTAAASLKRLLQRYAPKARLEIQSAFLGATDRVFKERHFVLKYTYRRGPAIDERMIVIEAR